jgi:hypothetical protein
MQTLPIKTFTDGLVPAFEQAKASREPLFVPANLYADDRGWSLMNQLQGVMSPQGQVNYSVMYPGVIKAWHHHTLQTDFWICVQGHLKVGIHRDEDSTSWCSVVGEKKPGVLIIPPPCGTARPPSAPSPRGSCTTSPTRTTPSSPMSSAARTTRSPASPGASATASP